MKLPFVLTLIFLSRACAFRALDQHIADELGRIDCVLTFKGSGFAEDRALLPTLVAAAGGATVPGTFIEIGALDGVCTPLIATVRFYGRVLVSERTKGWLA